MGDWLHSMIFMQLQENVHITTFNVHSFFLVVVLFFYSLRKFPKFQSIKKRLSSNKYNRTFENIEGTLLIESRNRITWTKKGIMLAFNHWIVLQMKQ